MNLIKSTITIGYVGWLLLAGVYAIVQLIRGGEPMFSWLGLALSAFGPVAFFVKVFILKSARRPGHPLEYSIVCGLGVALTMAMSYRYEQAAGDIHIWAGLSLLGWFLYLRSHR